MCCAHLHRVLFRCLSLRFDVDPETGWGDFEGSGDVAIYRWLSSSVFVRCRCAGGKGILSAIFGSGTCYAAMDGKPEVLHRPAVADPAH